jgi:hypothetical protein
MVETIQTDWRKLAASQFQGFNIRGSAGPWAALDYASNTVHLFEHELLARATGRKVQQLQIPQRRTFRKKFEID